MISSIISVVHFLLGFVIITFLPGFSILYIFFTKIKLFEKIIISIILSICIAIVFGLILHLLQSLHVFGFLLIYGIFFFCLALYYFFFREMKN